MDRGSNVLRVPIHWIFWTPTEFNSSMSTHTSAPIFYLHLCPTMPISRPIPSQFGKMVSVRRKLWINMHLFFFCQNWSHLFGRIGLVSCQFPRNGAAGFLAGCGSVLLTQPQVISLWFGYVWMMSSPTWKSEVPEVGSYLVLCHVVLSRMLGFGTHTHRIVYWKVRWLLQFWEQVRVQSLLIFIYVLLARWPYEFCPRGILSLKDR